MLVSFFGHKLYILVCSWEGFEHANSPKRGDMLNKIGMQLHPPYVETPASVVAKFLSPTLLRSFCHRAVPGLLDSLWYHA